MNTPAHAITSLLILGHKDHPETGPASVLGALLPDAPIEALLVIAGGLFLMRRYQARGLRLMIAGTVGLYAMYWAYVVAVWM